MQKYPRFSFIGGKFRTEGQKKEIINPSSGEALTEVGLASRADLEDAVEAARRAFDQGPWRSFSLEHRKAVLLKMSELILSKAKELATLESLNTGKPIKETTFMDIPSGAESFKYFGQNLQKFLVEERFEINTQIAQAKANLVREPRGVVGLIVPWNYPFLIAAWKVSQSLAAGNTVVLKPSSLTPLTALELAKIGVEAGLPEGALNVVISQGKLAGEVLCSHPAVDLISFTGSGAGGSAVIKQTAKNVKKTIMELGGKSANLVLDDADLDIAAKGIICSVFLNQGQMCTAASRILVDSSLYDRLTKKLKEFTARIKLGDALDFQTQMGPLISREQKNKVASFVSRAKREGLKITCRRPCPDEGALGKGFFFQPVLIEGVGPESFLFQEEIFGPVATITPFSSEEEAISLANNSDFGLAACIWTKDKKKAAEVAARLSAGAIWINTYGMFFNQTPFGGFKKSGFGKELGKAGFLEYTRLKNVITDQSKEGKPLVSYWYGF